MDLNIPSVLVFSLLSLDLSYLITNSFSFSIDLTIRFCDFAYLGSLIICGIVVRLQIIVDNILCKLLL